MATGWRPSASIPVSVRSSSSIPLRIPAPLSAEAVLERDQKREVRVVGPDGEPLTDVTVEGDGAETTKTPGLLTVSKLNPLRPKRFIFRHQAKKLVGFLIARGDETEPTPSSSQPWGTLTGRLVDAEGKPRPGVDLTTGDWQTALIDPARGLIPSGQKTDADGRFRFEGLVPGQEYSGQRRRRKSRQGGLRRRDRSRRAQARRDPRPGGRSGPPGQTGDHAVTLRFFSHSVAQLRISTLHRTTGTQNTPNLFRRH